MNKSIDIALADSEGSFYVSERKVYPRDVTGRFDYLRKVAVVWLLGMFYVFPWLRWDGRQAVLFDLPARKFYVFGLTFWPQDFLLLALLLIIAGVALFFFTALAGRLWCGYACPQTVWTEVFLWMERWTEGDRNARMKLDAAPWSSRKLLRKGGKHLTVAGVRAVDGLHLRRLLHARSPNSARASPLRLERLGNLLGAVLCPGDLGQCRFPARAGLQVHVPLCALPERDVRPQYAADRL